MGEALSQWLLRHPNLERARSIIDLARSHMQTALDSVADWQKDD